MRKAFLFFGVVAVSGLLPSDAVAQEGCSHLACVNYQCQQVAQPGADDCTACEGCDPTGWGELDCLSRNGRWDPELCVCSPPYCDSGEENRCVSQWGTWDPWTCSCWNPCNAGPPVEVGWGSYSEFWGCTACYMGLVYRYDITYYERYCEDGRTWESYGVGSGVILEQDVWPFCEAWCLEETPQREAGGVSGLGISPAQRPAMSTLPLHDRAQLAGGTLVEPYPDEGDVTSSTVAELFRRSPIVVIGKVLAQRAHLSADGQRVTTDVALDAQEVLRGPVVAGQVVRVSLPGGSHRFRDGVVVHQTTAGYQKPSIGGTYVLFLRASQPPLSDKTEYELAVGKQGQFELDFANARVNPGFGGAGLADPIATKARNTPLAEFLVELHAARRGGK